MLEPTLAASLLLLVTAVAAQHTSLRCDTQNELVSLLKYAHNTCQQVGESFDANDKFNLVPTTCKVGLARRVSCRGQGRGKEGGAILCTRGEGR